MSFSIVTDTSANLQNYHIKKHNITVIPFSYYIDGIEHTCTDTKKFNGDEFYDLLRNQVKVTTSQIVPQRYIEHMKPLLEQARDILFIGMSSQISGSFSSAQMAVQQLQQKYPERTIKMIDSLGASLGEGLLVLYAAEYRSEGISLDKTADRVLKLRDRMCQVFTVDDLMFLKRGGRISSVTALAGTMLNIKPLLKGNEFGQIVSYGKARGRKKSIEALADKYNSFAVNPERQTVAIAQAGCKVDALKLEYLLKEKRPPKEIIIVDYEPVTGSHVGPGALALFFLASDGVRET